MRGYGPLSHRLDQDGDSLRSQSIFPGAMMKAWLPTDKPLRGKVGEAIDYIRTFYAHWKDWLTPLPFSQVQKAIGMKCRQNFNQDIRKHPGFRDALSKLQVSEFSPNKSQRLTHFRRE